MDPTVDDELIGLLKTTSLCTEVKSEGWKYILRLSVSKDGLNHIINSGKYVPFMLSTICQENEEEELVRVAFKSLINIAAEEHGTHAIVSSRKDICSYLLNSISEEKNNNNFKCYLLANMSSKHEVIKMIIDILLSSKGLLQKLVVVYCSNEGSLRSDYDFLTLVFANVSRLTEGRRLFLQSVDFMTNLLKFTKAPVPESRRLGAALILRDCCLETDYHEKLLNDINILPALLLPLMVPKQYEEGGEMGCLPPELQQQCLDEVKGRDESVSVRRVLVEALTILCYSESSWRYLKSSGTYYVVRDLHAVETDDITKDAVEQLVAYLLVVEYKKPVQIEPVESIFEEVLTKHLERDFTTKLPAFVIKEEQ